MFRFTIRDVQWLGLGPCYNAPLGHWRGFFIGGGFMAQFASLVFIAAVAFPLIGNAAPGYPSRAPGQAYISTIRQQMLDRSPSWDAKDENPPLSARKAMKAAEAVVAKLEPDTDFWKRRLDGLYLCEFDSKWYWRVEYQWDPPKGTALGGMLPYMTIVVLMDGTVVPPTVDP